MTNLKTPLFLIFLFISGILFPNFSVAAIEDFTTYTEVDTQSVITVTSSKVSWENLDRGSDRVYADKGVEHFGDFEHLVTINAIDSITTGNGLQVWQLANVSNATRYIYPTLEVFLYYKTSSYRIYLYEYDDNNQYQGDVNVADIPLNSPRYLTIARSGTNLTVKIYTDAARTNLEDTLSLSGVTTTKFRYIYGLAGSDGTGDYNFDGYTENLDLQEVDTTPPVRSNGSPSGALPSGTTQTTLSLATNENATCKYSTTAGTSYDSMPNIFSTTGGTSHSTLITGLSDGNTYTYYLRCTDAAGNKNTDDFSISFSVALPGGDTTSPVRSNGQPTGTLAAGTTQTTLSLATNETATCKYGTVAGTAYASLPSTFSTTGGTSHSTLVTGLTDGNSYTYYVRCQDTAGNPNTDDFIISFSVASGAENLTTVGILSLVSTFENIGVYSNFSGDENGNNQAALEYRQVGGSWIQGMNLIVDRRAQVLQQEVYVNNPFKNQWRASIIGVNPNTAYEVRVTFVDSDGVSGANPVSATITTRNDNFPSTGSSYYVDTNNPSANDTNPGTEALPFKTIQKAADIVNPGDIVYVKAGTYSGRISISRSGTQLNFIYFRNYQNDKVILDAATSPSTCGAGSTGINKRCALVVSGSYLRIAGFEIINGDHGIKVDPPSHDVVIENNYIHGQAGTDANNYPILVGNSWGTQNSVANITIQNNEVHAKLGDPGSQVISFLGTSGGHVVRNNRIIFDYWGASGVHGTDCIGGTPNESVHGGFHKDTDVYDNYCEGATDEGIEVDGGNANVRIWNNTIVGSNVGFSIAPTMVGPAYIFRNVVYDLKIHWAGCLGVKTGDTGAATGHVYFYHNTFYSPSGSDCNDRVMGTGPAAGGFSENVNYKNNIMYFYSAPFYEYNTGSKPTSDYDLLSDVDGGIFAKWDNIAYYDFDSFVSGTGQETHGINGVASFVDPANGDFRLQAGSLGIDSGTVLIGFNDANSPWLYKGTAPDIGAYEYDSGAPPSYPSTIALNLALEAKTPKSGRSATVYIYTQGTSSLLKQNSLTTDSQGNLSLTMSDFNQDRIQTYDIKVKVSGYLVQKATQNLTGSSLTIPQLEAGDLNNDNTINSLDWAQMQSQWYTSNTTSDLNEDTMVNTIDFSFMNKNWLKAGD